MNARNTFAMCCSAIAIAFSATGVAGADIEHPQIRWAYQTDAPIRGAPAVGANTIYFGSVDGFVHALDKRSGDLRWRFQADGPVAGAPAVAGETIIVAGRGQTVYALDAVTGAPRWSFRMNPRLGPANEWTYFTAAPVVDGDQVLVPSQDGRLYALDLGSGKLRWDFQTADSLSAAPLVADGTIYQPSGDDHVYALSTRDGKLRWKFATAGVSYDLSSGFVRSDIFTRPMLANGLLVFGSRDANVYALDVRRRKKQWSFAYDSTWAMSTVIHGDSVYVGWSTNNRINALDLATGKKRWEFDAGSHTYTAGAVHGDAIYFGSANGNVHKLRMADGRAAWTYGVGADIYSSPVHDGENLYFGTDDGRMIALGEGAPRRHRAVYLPGNVPENIQGFVVDPAIAGSFTSRGYALLDSAVTLREWLQARTRDGEPSVVVFDFAQIPQDIVGDDPAAGLLRGYLEAGGKVVWPWGQPNLVVFDEAGKFVAYDPTVGQRLLGIDFMDFQDSGNYFARPTQIGRNWGLPAQLKTTFASLKPGANVMALALDELGRVSAFVRTFHPRPGSGWVTYSPKGFGVPISASELAALERIAEYGLR